MIVIKLYIKEEWKDVVGFEGFYKVSNFGRIYSIRNKRVLTLKKNVSHTYMEVELNVSGKPYYFRVHRLVALAFLPNPLSLPYVNHKDCCKQNNKVWNLEWISASNNCNHAIAHGRYESIYGRITHTLFNESESIFARDYKDLSKLTGYTTRMLAKYSKSGIPLRRGTYKGYKITTQRHNLQRLSNASLCQRDLERS